MLGSLGEALRNSVKKLIGHVLIDKKAVEEFIKEVQKALISSDVDIELVFSLTSKIKEHILASNDFSRKEQIIKIVYDELVSFLGKGGDYLSVKKKPYKILLVGLFGSGKTTTAGKLALRYRKKGYKTAVLALDTFRAAAVEQLKQVATGAGVSFFGNFKEKKAGKIVKEFKKDYEAFDVIIGDSAGRDMLDLELIKEVKDISKEFCPDEVLLVIPADIGQVARKQAEAFKQALNISGVIITKLDSTAKGGGALTACAVSGAPVKFIGTGEGVDDFEQFNPERFVSRLLGMGDIESLLEKAKEELDTEKVKDLGEKLLKGEFNFIDMNEQLKAVGKMGSFSKLFSFIPGISNMKLPEGVLDVQEANAKKFQVIMNSMTKEELENPKILSVSRIERIAKGSGTTETDVRMLIKQYTQMRSVMKKMKGGNLKKLMKQLGIKDMKQLENMDMSNLGGGI